MEISETMERDKPRKAHLHVIRSLKWKIPAHTGWIKKASRHQWESVHQQINTPSVREMQQQTRGEQITNNESWRIEHYGNSEEKHLLQLVLPRAVHVLSTCLQERREGFCGRKAGSSWAKILSGKKAYSRQFSFFWDTDPFQNWMKAVSPLFKTIQV